ncbi:LPS-assembly lipoprotein [Phyllobacterium leguminum]|uniref:LPS-assembly lipoprotein n=2 Tax=Phyllobacterium leguminum TaxID=314237 RepID=A0A318T0F8_9HYPH|nr:LPS-assembly lipoprotein [Phyllobacterium leguminum]
MRQSAFFAVLAGTLLAAAGCTVQPLYSGGGPETSLGGSVQPAMREKLASIEIEPATTRYGQEVRNKLIFLLSGGAGEPVSPAYRLSLGVTSYTTAAVSVDIGDSTDRTGRPSAGTVNVSSNYVLRDVAGKPVAKGTRSVRSSFDRPRQEFANLRAERDAQDRAAEELAQQLMLALAQNMARQR